MGQHVTIFGVRHHGPGSARSLVRALTALKPDVLLLEGPPDAQAVLPFAVSADMRPPVALVVYPPDQPGRGVFYPFASFSPEWNALRYALGRGIPARLCDLPQAFALAVREQAEPNEAERAPAADPIRLLAQAAGEPDPERWWEQLVEQRRDDADVFRAVSDAMAAVREGMPEPTGHEGRREAHMRQMIRTAEREGFARIAVVCGAWHAPALANRPPAPTDADLLRGLERVRVEATWVPWTASRLASASGYGAGVESPAWYRHLWETNGSLATWMAAAARLLRDQELDASPAQVVEAVRLAEALAALRGRPQASLADVSEATLSVLCAGEAARLGVISRKLIVGDDMGTLPADVPTVPLQRDLDALIRRLRLRLDPEERPLNLDLRQGVHREQSQLLHRLRLLGIEWGRPQAAPSGSHGTFHELWRLQWRPELALALIEAGVYGNTVMQAATARAIERGQQAGDLTELATLVQRALMAGLTEASATLVGLLGARSAESTDVSQMLCALPPLATALRYGDVRATSQAVLAPVTLALAERAMAGLGPACAEVDTERARALARQIAGANRAVVVLQSPRTGREDGGAAAGGVVPADAWWAALARLADQATVPGLIAGTCCRLLLGTDQMTGADAAARLRRALVGGAEPTDAAGWIEGFLTDSGLALATSEDLFRLVDHWLVGLPGERFMQVLPLLRRTTATFAAGERQQVAERVSSGTAPLARATADETLDAERAALVEPIVLTILGVER